MIRAKFVFPLVLLSCILIGCGKKADPIPNSVVKPPSDSPTATRPDKADFKTTAEAIAKEIFADEKAASAKYMGKYVELEGQVAFANKVIKEDGLIMDGGKKVPTDSSSYSIRLFVAKPDLEKVWFLGAEQKVSAFGRVQAVNQSSLDLDQVTVKESEPSPVLKMTAEALAAEYAKDGDASQKKYITKGYHREIALTGVVAELLKENDFFILTLTGSGTTKVRCTFLDDDWKLVKVGDNVTVKGNLSSFDAKKANSPSVSTAFLVKKN